MNREIKFRAWDKEVKEMLYPEDCLLRVNFNGEILDRYGVERGEFELMQYIGLKDKWGKKVYHGDILKVTADKDGYGILSYEGFVFVKFTIGSYSLEMFNPSQKEMDEQCIPFDSSSLWHIYGDDGKWIEVIGNAYETPELLLI
jgi:uncharacterized phage protein (TIGR01671 family)